MCILKLISGTYTVFSDYTYGILPFSFLFSGCTRFNNLYTLCLHKKIGISNKFLKCVFTLCRDQPNISQKDYIA